MGISHVIVKAITAPLLIHKGNTKHFEMEKFNGPMFDIIKKSCVNSDLLVKGINAMFPIVDCYPGKCIVWNRCRAHISKKLKDYFCLHQIRMIVIPDGCTPYL